MTKFQEDLKAAIDEVLRTQGRSFNLPEAVIAHEEALQKLEALIERCVDKDSISLIYNESGDGDCRNSM